MAKDIAVMNFSVSIVVNQTRDLVAEALMNPNNFPYWQTDLERFEVMERKPGEIGSRGRLHYSQRGKKYVLEDRLVSCDPGRSYVSQVTGDALEARVETILASFGDKTEMTINWSGEGRVLLLRLLLPLMRGRMIRRTREELETFKGLVETRGGNFSVQPGTGGAHASK